MYMNMHVYDPELELEPELYSDKISEPELEPSSNFPVPQPCWTAGHMPPKEHLRWLNPSKFYFAIFILLGSIAKHQRVGIWRNGVNRMRQHAGELP